MDDAARDYEVFNLGDVALAEGGVLPDAKLAYKVYGRLNAAKDNAVVMPTYYTGTHRDNEAFFGPGRALDPADFCIIVPNLFGNGLSSSPSNTAAPCHGPDFPRVTLADNVTAQRRLLQEVFGVDRVALVLGWSMGGCQAYQWAAQYPQAVERILPFCASARVSPHNFVFLEGVRAALQADCAFDNGNYEAPPITGLKAFARVYCGWAFSQAFFRNGEYRELGFDSIEEILRDWENDHLTWDANDLLAKLSAWQNHDVSRNLFGGDLREALAAIEARAIVLPCSTDLYFTPEDNEIEVAMMRRAELRVFESTWGHCVPSGGCHAGFQQFLDEALGDLLMQS
jgi:homoserine O-acetyltransferase